MKKILLLAIISITSFSFAFGQSTFWQEFSEFETVNISKLLSTGISNQVFIKPNDDDIYVLNENYEWLKYSNNISNVSISDVLELKDGSIYFSSNLDGIYKYENNELIPKNNGLTNTRATCLFADEDGVIYTGTWFEGGLYRSNNNGESWELLGLENTDITDFVKYNNKYFVAIDGQGIRESNDLEDWSTSWLGQGSVYKFYFLNDGTMLAITSSGILIYEDETWKAFHSSVNQRNITDLIETQNGTFIFLQSDGKVFRSFDKFENIQELSGIDGDTRIFYIATDRSNRLIAGTNNGCYYSSGKIDQKNIYIDYYFESDSIVDFANPVYLNLNLIDDFGNPLNNHKFSYFDSRVPNESIEAETNSAGFASLVIEADYFEADGEYTITLTDNDGSEYKFAKTYEIDYQVKIETSPELEIELVKLFQEPVKKNQTIEFELYTKYYFSDQLKAAPNVSVVINNDLTNEDINMDTDDDGILNFSITIPSDASNGDYTITITSNDETFVQSVDFTDTFNVNSDVSVDEDVKRITFHQTGNTLLLNSENLINNIKIYDINGKKALEKNINNLEGFVELNNLSGFYICLIEIDGKLITKKIII